MEPLLLFVFRVCLSYRLDCSLQQPCGHMLGKGGPRGSLVCYDFLYFIAFPCGVLGLSVILDCIDN